MSAFLLLLVKLNLAMGAAIILVSLLRRPLRLLFGAPIAYAIWFLVPTASLASLLPPRVVAAAPLAPPSVMGLATQTAFGVTEQLTGPGALVPAIPPPASIFAWPDTGLLLFAAWALGMFAMALYLTRLQARFHAAVRLGKAGPAVLGFLRPRIVMPDGFCDRFSAQEQAAILAHERVHLARQDARINALTALLRCLCWFNPLIHLGARWLRIDQELACDATVVAKSVSRRTYAKALLKSQLVVTALPLGCNWPGSQHPLVDRIALLKRQSPGTARRLAGTSLVLLAASFAGLGAWAAQPPVTATSIVTQPDIALVALPVATSGQTGGEPATYENPTGSGNDGNASHNAGGAVSAAPSPERPRTVSIQTRLQSALSTLPQIASIATPPEIADPSTAPASQDAAPEPKETEAQKIATAPATRDGAPAGAASGPPRTEAALACLLGMARDGCEAAFVGEQYNNFYDGPHAITPFEASRLISYCTEEYIHRFLDRCDAGPLETVQYLGPNVAGDDVYLVKFMHQEKTYVISQPGADGKIPAIWVFRSSPTWVVRRKDLVELQAPTRAPRTIYRAER